MKLLRAAVSLLAALGLTVAASSLSAQEAGAPRKLMPVDEAAKDPTWVNFRKRLLEALQKHDRKYLLSILDRNIRNPLDAPRGVAAFSKHWDIDADDSPVWRELPGALFLGSAWLKPEKGARQLCAPYVAAKWPDDIDPFDYGAITTREALVKSEPSSEADTTASLSYDIVRVTDWEIPDRAADAKQKWVKLRLNEKEAYVPEEHIRSPIEYRACFIKAESGWRMVAFVIGVEK
jgi:hypothetical protein